MTNHVTLTPERFDRLAVELAPKHSKILWGCKAIAKSAGTTEEFIRNVIARGEGTPIRKIGRRYCVVENDLLDFIRR